MNTAGDQIAFELARIRGGVAFAQDLEAIACPFPSPGPRFRGWAEGFAKACVADYSEKGEAAALFHVERRAIRTQATWLPIEKLFLELAWKKGLPKDITARVLRRSPSSVITMASRLGCSERLAS